MPDSKKIKIKYLKAYDFKTSFITGIHGGLANNGIINANFFADRASMPDFQEVVVENNILTKQVNDVKDSDVVREIQFGCYVDVNTAKVIINWLQGRVNEFEEKFKK